MRFILDENIHSELLPWLQSLKTDARIVAKGTDDRTLAMQAKTESRIIITHDTDFAKTRNHPIDSHAGVILIRINSLYFDKTTVALKRVFEQFSADQLSNRIILVLGDRFQDITEEILVDLR